MSVLVFPSCIDSCLPFIEEARRLGQRLVGASSLADDPHASRFDVWSHLPYLQDESFTGALAALIKDEKITSLFTSHAPTFHFFSQHPALLTNKVNLLGPGPYAKQSGVVRNAFVGIDEKMQRIDRYANRSSNYTQAFIASLLHHAEQIYGECQTEKILALCGALADAPAGDVIEIGSFFGKSAYVLNRIATATGVGTTLAVDSWNMAISVQKESPEEIQSLSAVWDWELVFQGFLMAMASSAAGGGFNYLRLPSDQAWRIYDANKGITSPEFGHTQASGQIALLHIDGNHDEACVREDFQLWSQRLANQGWLVFDDYAWSHGNGPRIVADQVVADYADRVLRRFVAGGALFLKMAR